MEIFTILLYISLKQQDKLCIAHLFAGHFYNTIRRPFKAFIKIQLGGNSENKLTRGH